MRRLRPTALAALCAALLIVPAGVRQAAGASSGSRVPHAGQASVLARLALAQRDEHDLARARPGERNLDDLTRRLKLHLLTPISSYVRSTPPHYSVGSIDTFWIAEATSGYFAMKAKLLLVTPHAYWYVQQNMGIPANKLMAALQTSAHDFESHVYPTDVAAFGRPIPRGPNDDPRITVLCANLPGVGGYYSAEDLYPRIVNPYSNQRKMLYVSITSYPLGTPDFDSTIAHELQHMIHWYQHENDDTWINEGSSVLAQVLTGYTPEGLDQAFAGAPGTQLDYFCYGAPYCSDAASADYYGGSFLWMDYFYQHYGGDRAMRAVLADKRLSGMLLFDDVLARLGSHDRARDVFRKWAIANLVDDPRIDGGIYGYQPTYAGCCVHAAITTAASAYPYTRHATVNQFATDYVQLNPMVGAGASTLHLRFSGDPTVRIVPNTPIQDGQEWWSNRGDQMDSTLTRTFDLRHLRHATLTYDIWYDVEQDFDYGYVEVSTDGGHIWYTLPAQHTTDSNPNGGNYGHGYTGASAAVRGNRGGWLHESVDLSPYAGKMIQVRFEHITYDAYNRSGLTLDNIQVPQLGFKDAPGTTGWQTQGWVRIANALPTRWLVQLVLYTTHGVQVRQMPLSATAGGTATISGLGHDVQRVVLAISPTAPQTTVPSSYTLSVAGS